MQSKQDRSYPEQKVTIVGAGIIGYISVYYLWQKALKEDTKIRVALHDKNQLATDTTTSNIFPSLTIDEIMSVVPLAPELAEKLKILFSQPGGIRVDDVADVNNSQVFKEFIHALEQYGLNVPEHLKRVEVLFGLGVMSMNAWQEMYVNADEELKDILVKSNFQPCREPLKTGTPELHDGYRIDLIYNKNEALLKAQGMCTDYASQGYKHCEVLTPEEVMRRDPHLTKFCKDHSTADASGTLVWNSDAAAVWRPGGCIDTQVFLPLFHDYLTKKMGTYVNEEGIVKNCFRRHLDRNVEGLSFENGNITGMNFAGKDALKQDKHKYPKSEYLFCTGEKVGTLKKLGLPEPEYARFAGPSLHLVFDIPEEYLEQFSTYNHCMEVHQEGVVLAWQGRVIDGKLSLGVAGTKAFYGDKEPTIDQEFAKNRNILQLNMINDVLPQVMSIALGRDTQGHKLTETDLQILVDKGIAKRWVGTRAVAFDGFPTIGRVAANGKTITHAGSGGVSFSHALVKSLFGFFKPEEKQLVDDALSYANPARTYRQ